MALESAGPHAAGAVPDLVHALKDAGRERARCGRARPWARRARARAPPYPALVEAAKVEFLRGSAEESLRKIQGGVLAAGLKDGVVRASLKRLALAHFYVNVGLSRWLLTVKGEAPLRAGRHLRRLRRMLRSARHPRERARCGTCAACAAVFLWWQEKVNGFELVRTARAIAVVRVPLHALRPASPPLRQLRHAAGHVPRLSARAAPTARPGVLPRLRLLPGGGGSRAMAEDAARGAASAKSRWQAQEGAAPRAVSPPVGWPSASG